MLWQGETIMKRIAGFSGLIFFGLSLTGAGETLSTDRVPVLLELFTSEGCSSCPPADKLLQSLDRSQPVAGADLIVLSEHVDYWNHGGWADPWSSAANTARQQEYVRRFHLDSAYTPQLVVDGRSELVGSDGSEARGAISKAIRDRKLPISISSPERENGNLKVHLEIPSSGNGPTSEATVYIALADNEDMSHVAGGENGGRTISHVAVVRAFGPVGTVAKGQQFTKDVNVPLKPGVGASGLRVVAFVQDKATGRVIGVAQRRIAKL
jgi:hypothetical protein